jgi:hypothetical protein
MPTMPLAWQAKGMVGITKAVLVLEWNWQKEQCTIF